MALTWSYQNITHTLLLCGLKCKQQSVMSLLATLVIFRRPVTYKLVYIRSSAYEKSTKGHILYVLLVL